MTVPVKLPKEQWAELCDPEDITKDQKSAYARAVDRMLYGENGGQVSYVPDPDNPAVVIPVEPKAGRLTADNLLELQEMAHLSCIRAWSYDRPVNAEGYGPVSQMAVDAIEAAMNEHGHYGVFNGTGPKGTTETDFTSSSTSEDTGPTPLQE